MGVVPLITLDNLHAALVAISFTIIVPFVMLLLIQILLFATIAGMCFPGQHHGRERIRFIY
jgi:uncharacterized paraquat-inducible protein A